MNWRFLALVCLALLLVGLALSVVGQGQSGTVISAWPGAVGSSGGNAPIRGAAQPQPMPDTRGTSSAVDAYLSGLAASNQFSGAVLVAKRGTVVLAKGYGLANVATNTPNTPETRFRLASVTKQFTSMAVMQLVAQGKLKLDSSVCAYVPQCPGGWQPITLKHLLTHTSGLPNFTDLGSYEATMAQPTTPEALVARFRDLPLNSEPGSVYHYGNSGYVLLGYIVERVSGQSYAEYLRDHVFGPLGMANSGYDVGDTHLAQGYAAPGVPCSVLNATTLFSAGGLYSTVRDMYRWDQALYGSKLLPDDLRSQIFTPQVGNYGFGWLILQHNGQRTVEHPGLMSGAATHIARLPDAGITVIVLSNLETANVDAISNQLIALALTA